MEFVRIPHIFKTQCSQPTAGGGRENRYYRYGMGRWAVSQIKIQKGQFALLVQTSGKNVNGRQSKVCWF